jgi:uncharacterized membrane protein YhaH (DUF805 family)
MPWMEYQGPQEDRPNPTRAERLAFVAVIIGAIAVFWIAAGVAYVVLNDRGATAFAIGVLLASAVTPSGLIGIGLSLSTRRDSKARKTANVALLLNVAAVLTGWATAAYLILDLHG